jgi:hypothetical protein
MPIEVSRVKLQAIWWESPPAFPLFRPGPADPTTILPLSGRSKRRSLRHFGHEADATRCAFALYTPNTPRCFDRFDLPPGVAEESVGTSYPRRPCSFCRQHASAIIPMFARRTFADGEGGRLAVVRRRRPRPGRLSDKLTRIPSRQGRTRKPWNPEPPKLRCRATPCVRIPEKRSA